MRVVGGIRGRKSSFSEEKEAKRLLSVGASLGAASRLETKVKEVFWFFFSKKNPSLSWRLGFRATHNA
jgi:hypothetical protein